MSDCKDIQAAQLLELMAAASTVRAALAQFISAARAQGYQVNGASAGLSFYEDEGDFFGKWEIGNVTEDVGFTAVVGGSL